jgi:lipoprotein-releasing system ATP-binding protein
MNDMPAAAAIELADVSRTFEQSNARLEVLCGINLKLVPGEVVALTGPSGAGKSTLLHIAGLLERPDGGDVKLNGVGCNGLNETRRTSFRRLYLGFVYQFHHLLPEFSALENVAMPRIIAGESRAAAMANAAELLADVGLSERESHRPARLSGGEQQRVAIARALANRPRVLLADEPTGNLDRHTADTVFEVLLRVARGAGLAALIATHNVDLAARMDRTLVLDEGRVAAG